MPVWFVLMVSIILDTILKDHRHLSLKSEEHQIRLWCKVFDTNVPLVNNTSKLYIEYSFARYYKASNSTSIYLLTAYSSNQIHRSQIGCSALSVISVPDLLKGAKKPKYWGRIWTWNCQNQSDQLSRHNSHVQLPKFFWALKLLSLQWIQPRIIFQNRRF